MAVITFAGTSVRQPDESERVSSNGKTFSVAFKDLYSVLQTKKESITVNSDTYDGKLITEAILRRHPGNTGVLELTLSPVAGVSGEGSQATVKALRAVWSCKSVRNDKSILAYCGENSKNPNRAWIEAWMAERDEEIASACNYRKDDGTVANIDTDLENAVATTDLMAKIRRGIDSVIRFYPVLTCTATYSDIPSTFIEHLGYIDSPQARSADETKAPGNLSAIINAYHWLKIQDDVQETGDGKFQRVESWMGNENQWDPNLYGSERWAMPHDYETDSPLE